MYLLFIWLEFSSVVWSFLVFYWSENTYMDFIIFFFFFNKYHFASIKIHFKKKENNEKNSNHTVFIVTEVVSHPLICFTDHYHLHTFFVFVLLRFMYTKRKPLKILSHNFNVFLIGRIPKCFPISSNAWSWSLHTLPTFIFPLIHFLQKYFS